MVGSSRDSTSTPVSSKPLAAAQSEGRKLPSHPSSSPEQLAATQSEGRKLPSHQSASEQLLEWDAWGAIETLKEVARALQFMQDNDVLHGDLKVRPLRYGLGFRTFKIAAIT